MITKETNRPSGTENVPLSALALQDNEYKAMGKNIKMVTQREGSYLTDESPIRLLQKANSFLHGTFLRDTLVNKPIRFIDADGVQSSVNASRIIQLNSANRDNQSVPERRIIAGDLKAIQLALLASMQRSPERYHNAIQLLHVELQSALDKYQGQNGHLSYQDTKLTHIVFKKLAKQLPKGELKELCHILAQHTKCDWMQMKHEKLQAKQLSEYLELGKPGAGKATAYHTGINVGASLLAVPGTETKVGPFAELSLGVATENRFNVDDEGLVFEEKSHSLSAGVAGGLQAKLANEIGMSAQANAIGKSSLTYFKEWNNSKDYIAQNGPYTRRTKGLQKQKQWVANSQHRLNELLNRVLKMKANVHAPAPERTKPLTGFYKTTTGEVSASINAGTAFKVGELDVKFGGGLGASRSKSTTDIYEFVPSYLADVVLKNSAKLNELPANFTQHARQIIDSSLEFKDKPKTAIGGLSLLKADLNVYYEVVQKYDYYKSYKHADKTELKALRAQKHAIENRWGAIGRHQFLQFASASHALFASTIMPNKQLASAIDPKREQALVNLIGQTGVLAQNPTIDYSKSRLDRIATFKQEVYLQVADTNSSFDITAGPFKGQLTVVERQRLHPSRVREGRYIDVILTGTIASSVQGLVKGLTIKEAIAEHGIELPGELDIIPDIGAGASLSHTTRFFKPEYSQANDYTGEKGWRKQFSRNTKTVAADINLGGSGTVAAGAHVGVRGGMNHKVTKVMNEKIASDDLTFTMVRFNRFYRDAKLNTDNTAWKAFFKDNEAEYRKMFLLLGSKSHPMKEEVTYFFNELIKLAPLDQKGALRNQYVHFFEAMADFRADEENLDKFHNAQASLEYYLEQQTVPWWEAHTSRWKDLEFKPEANSGLDWNSKLWKKLGLHTRANSFPNN
ncbi:hypothetical protein [Vibrio sagamiensis]|uniref:Uncharacterized protein n=1 Tax=Vibrio sagamiensis NBRC 104589 TaxID=1219064 RepID=A0A511QFQ3_9VIBR|nr:hypothetical protein [Vibrio sagamiensis]PNQ54383.1 hypothetical protein C1141_16150 [Vibrio agarivorans]GEM75272.1 hypothetical protein VSA01S_13840 [Vibrio sagamiensis NBRC 104589]